MENGEKRNSDADPPPPRKAKSSELSSSLSIHGLPNVFVSQHILIRLVWLLTFFAGLSVLGYLTYNSAGDYASRNVTWHDTAINVKSLAMPMMAICDSRISRPGDYTPSVSVTNCLMAEEDCMDNITILYDRFSSCLFVNTSALSQGQGGPDFGLELMLAAENTPPPKGNMRASYRQISLQLFLYEQAHYPIQERNRFLLSPNFHHDIPMEKWTIERLGSPYPSNCKSGTITSNSGFYPYESDCRLKSRKPTPISNITNNNTTNNNINNINNNTAASNNNNNNNNNNYNNNNDNNNNNNNNDNNSIANNNNINNNVSRNNTLIGNINASATNTTSTSTSSSSTASSTGNSTVTSGNSTTTANNNSTTSTNSNSTITSNISPTASNSNSTTVMTSLPDLINNGTSMTTGSSNDTSSNTTFDCGPHTFLYNDEECRYANFLKEMGECEVSEEDFFFDATRKGKGMACLYAKTNMPYPVCPLPCQQTNYKAVVSRLPYEDNQKQSDQWTTMLSGKDGGQRKSDDYSMVSLNLFYPDLIVHEGRETPMYSFGSFVSEIGGLMGLFLGASVYSLIEILMLVTVVVWEMCCGIATRRKDKTEEKTAA